MQTTTVFPRPSLAAEQAGSDGQATEAKGEVGPGPGYDDDDHPRFQTDEFRVLYMKVVSCSKRFCHDWTICPFAHPGEKARRRDPRVFQYTGVACPDMKKSGSCVRGEKCPYAHTVFEYWLHPTRYRTQLCNDGPKCRRRVCFFAHTLDQLRIPSSKPFIGAEALASIIASSHPFASQGSGQDGMLAMPTLHEGPALAPPAAPAASPHPPRTAASPAPSGDTDASAAPPDDTPRGLASPPVDSHLFRPAELSLDTRPGPPHTAPEALPQQAGAGGMLDLSLANIKAALTTGAAKRDEVIALLSSLLREADSDVAATSPPSQHMPAPQPAQGPEAVLGRMCGELGPRPSHTALMSQSPWALQLELAQGLQHVNVGLSKPALGMQSAPLPVPCSHLAPAPGCEELAGCLSEANMRGMDDRLPSGGSLAGPYTPQNTEAPHVGAYSGDFGLSARSSGSLGAFGPQLSLGARMPPRPAHPRKAATAKDGRRSSAPGKSGRGAQGLQRRNADNLSRILADLNLGSGGAGAVAGSGSMQRRMMAGLAQAPSAQVPDSFFHMQDDPAARVLMQSVSMPVHRLTSSNANLEDCMNGGHYTVEAGRRMSTPLGAAGHLHDLAGCPGVPGAPRELYSLYG